MCNTKLMRQKHSRLSLCVTLMILLGWCVCPQLRAYDVVVGGIYYNLSGTSATVTYPTESAPTAAGTDLCHSTDGNCLRDPLSDQCLLWRN